MGKINGVPFLKNIGEYNWKINIPEPKYRDFDIRDFEDNMKTVRLTMPPFRISFFQLAILESGGGKVTSDGKAHDLDNFTLFFNIPNQIIYWDIPKNWRGYYVSVTDSFYTMRLEEYNSLYNLPFFRTFTPSIKLNANEARLILDMMAQMHSEYQSPSDHKMMVIKSYLNTVLSYCIRFFDRENHDQYLKSKNTRLSDRFRELIRIRLNSLIADVGSKELTSGSCADELFVTPKYLSEAIKKDLGVTPTEYIQEALITEAQRLLVTTNLQVKEIAYHLGFNDPAYFNRLFKQLTKTSPAKYRELSKEAK